MGGRSASFLLKPVYSRLPYLEDEADRFYADRERLRFVAKIVITELFDNIVAHAEGVLPKIVLIRFESGIQDQISFRYHTSNFCTFVASLGARMEERCKGYRVPRPLFDCGSDRYRGLGLRMCAGLTQSIETESGLFWSKVKIVL